jgi:transposase
MRIGKKAQQRSRAQLAAAVVGVDAGKFTHSLVSRRVGSVDSKSHTFRTTRDGFDLAVAKMIVLSGGASPSEILVGIEFAGVYGFTFAYYLQQKGFQVVSVLASHSKRWKEVMHNQAIKTDAKDAETITDLVAIGQFVSFPFLKKEYAELRYLVSARDHVSIQRTATLTRLKSVLQVVWPEFEQIFPKFHYITPLKLLARYPGPGDLLKAPKRQVVKLLKEVSRNHLGEKTYQQLVAAAECTVGLPIAQGALKGEIPLLIEQIDVYARQMELIESRMEEVLQTLPEAECLVSIPGVAPVSAAIFLGLIGDPQAYESSKQVLKLAGLSLVERSSGIKKGQPHISKRGKPLLRKQLFMLALRAVRSDGMFRDRFVRHVARTGGKKLPVVVAVAREMLCLMFSIARERRHYTVEPPKRQNRHTEVAA